jgi:uncharacterized membrane protein
VRNRWIGLVVAAISLAAGIWAFPRLPAEVATHWNFRGEPDGYSSRFVAAFVFPLAILVLAGLAWALPKIDPKGRDYLKFHDTYWLLINGILIFMGFAHLMVLAAGVGLAVRIQTVMPIAVGFLFVVIGNYLARVQPNWFVGIRTPWTLSSDTVWRKTHRLGAWVFVIAGLVFMAMPFVPGAAGTVPFALVVVGLILTPIVYSFYLWMRERSS